MKNAKCEIKKLEFMCEHTIYIYLFILINEPSHSRIF